MLQKSCRDDWPDASPYTLTSIAIPPFTTAPALVSSSRNPFFSSTRADALATSLYTAAQAHLPGMRLRTDYTDGDPDQEAAFYLLRPTNCPAVLTENLFMDNPTDCAFLLSPEGQQARVDLHVDGIISYLESEHVFPFFR